MILPNEKQSVYIRIDIKSVKSVSCVFVLSVIVFNQQILLS